MQINLNGNRVEEFGNEVLKERKAPEEFKKSF